MAIPGQVERRLRQGAGCWRGEERMPPSDAMPEGSVATGRSEARLSAGGTLLVSEYEQQVEGEVTMRGLSVMSWNPEPGRYEMYWFDGTGSPPSVLAGTVEGDALVLIGEGPGGSRIRHRTTHPDARTMRTVSEISFDGSTWTAAFEAVYVREED